MCCEYVLKTSETSECVNSLGCSKWLSRWENSLKKDTSQSGDDLMTKGSIYARGARRRVLERTCRNERVHAAFDVVAEGIKIAYDTHVKSAVLCF